MYKVIKSEPQLWTLGETYSHDGEEHFETMEDFSTEAEAMSELHRCVYGKPLIPDATDGPTADDRIALLEQRVADLDAKNAALEVRLNRLSKRLDRLSGYVEDMPGGSEL